MTKNNYSRWVVSCIPIFVLLSLHPSQLGKIGIVNGKVLALSFFVLFIIMVFFLKKKISLKINVYQVVLFIQIFFFMLFSIFSESSAELLSVWTLLSVFVFYSFLRSDDELLVRSARFYVLVMSAISVGSLIAVIGFYSGYFRQIFLITTGSGRDLYLIGPSLTTETLIHDGIVRPAGPFTEPGQLGVHIIFALILNFLLGCNRKREVVLFMGGLFTLSLGTYVSLFLYLILLRLKLSKTVRLLFPVLISISVLLVFLYFYKDVFDYVYMRIANLTNFGNRLMGYQVFFDNLYAVDLFGIDEKYSDMFYTASTDATVFGMFIRYGYLGGILVNLHVFIFLIKALQGALRSNILKARILFTIVCMMISILLHRPFVLMFSFYFLTLLVHSLSIPRSKLFCMKSQMFT